MESIKDLQHVGLKKWYHYKWIPIYAAELLHESVFDYIDKNINLPRTKNILILWSWWWAFDQRLLDEWFLNITSIDYISEDYKVNWTKFIEFNLNKDFDVLWKFDLIIALEIIEHLENSFHFIRNIKKILNEKWNLLLSSPNISSKFVRLNFFLTWKLWYFQEKDLLWTWHISPLLEHILIYNLSLNNLYIKDIFTNQLLDPKMKDIFSFRSFIWYFFYKIIYFFIKWNNNQINIYNIKHK